MFRVLAALAILSVMVVGCATTSRIAPKRAMTPQEYQKSEQDPGAVPPPPPSCYFDPYRPAEKVPDTVPDTFLLFRGDSP